MIATTDERTELTFRRIADSELGSAANALERAADSIQRLTMRGITYTAEDGDLLGQVHQLAERVLAMQSQVRTENHR